MSPSRLSIAASLLLAVFVGASNFRPEPVAQVVFACQQILPDEPLFGSAENADDTPAPVAQSAGLNSITFDARPAPAAGVPVMARAE
jgi:hypothetical protein